MIVPQYWAEARVQHRVRGRQVTVRRFGWSDESLEAAQANADARAREALDRILAGETLRRREPKVSYNGAEGVPIREEIISRHGETIVTRNIYGARCLNTSNVLFADVDFAEAPGCNTYVAVFAVLASVACAVGWEFHSRLVAGIGLGLAALLVQPVVIAWHHLLTRLRGDEEERARRRIEKFLEARPEWYLRVHRTPAGLRLLAMHRTFLPSEPETAEFFQAMCTDPLYVRMCSKQSCFRARVSPKPWRIGMTDHVRPRPGVWPINPERMPDREHWVAAYEQAAKNYASCRFVEALGSGRVDSSARAVQVLHDQLCHATESRPIA